jgi:transposase-like protein
MERRKFTPEFKLEVVWLIKQRGGWLCPGLTGPECALVAVAQLGEDVSG